MKQRKSLELAPAEWLELEIIARDLGILSQRGPTPGQPSWRALIRAIAQGRAVVSGNEQQTFAIE